MIKFFNTLTRELEEFKPMEPPQVKLYTCGPTIHDFAHIGNFRTYVFEDLLRRYLKFRGYEVFQVMNLTDVEDKIIKKSIEAGIPMREYTDKYAQAFFEDLATLNIEPAEVYPRATESVDKMVEIIRKLLKDGIAYKAADGSIYYDIAKFPEYGKLACIQVDELVAGARVAQDEYDKERACDFALWKAWDANDGDVFWDQYEDLGKGRPGWHIECSAMSIMHLGERFDMHTGGVDNIFPHHQNEIAQSEAFTGVRFVNYWLHSEHLQVENEKMSKSLKNFYTVRDLMAKGHDPTVVRYQLLSAHYRSRLNFKFDGLTAAEASLERITGFLRRCSETPGASSNSVSLRAEAIRHKFIEAMDEDLNISGALAAIFEGITEINKLVDEGAKAGDEVLEVFEDLDRVLGFKLKERYAEEGLPADLQELLDRRIQARKDKDWKLSDQLRNELLEKGVAIEDTPQGVRWKRVAPAR